ncbi:glyoxal oxidase [Artomyces pyxidatus]|uniref:Glyoxal oxidase n=1 Tax=Artomyces pyxidatus TaxID=48021 RepID=A0ACB8TD33_9AGAM|nr:glyoxal oxidase [Artomyces pyxidatus]
MFVTKRTAFLWRGRPGLFAAAASAFTLCTAAGTAPPPGQPASIGPVGTYQVVGDSVVSAQQLFLGTADKVYIVDKTEKNPTSVNGHPAWAAEYALGTNVGRPMDVVTNSFCAGGNVLGNGTWVNIGGNQAVTYGGVTANSQNGGMPYDDPDGGKSIRLLDPCDDGNCDWVLAGGMTTRRWYPSVETLEDGSLLVIGGCQWGGFVNDGAQTNPTYEFFPPRGNPVTSPMLTNTLPANLYPLTFLLPSGRVLVQANWQTAVLDYKTGTEYRIDDIPDAVRTYPASAGVVMMPLTPANNWTATIMFCGGSNLQPNQWVTNWNIAQYPASQSCVQITPDVSGSYVHVDALPENRSMGNLIMLPNGQVLCINGAGTGVAGYGNDTWAIGQSYADRPVLDPVMFNASAPAGSQWSRNGFSPSTIPRMYHSVATLLPDGAVLVSGSNPNSDYNLNTKYPTEYRIEKFYPPYFGQRRPQPNGLPLKLGYGGAPFNVTLSKQDLFDDSKNVNRTKIVLMRMGFSTHAMNMGQRLIELEKAYTVKTDGSAVLHCSQLPPNPAIFPPGPAYIFVVVNDVPSVGVQIMVGSGQIGEQPIQAPAPLPMSSSQLQAFVDDSVDKGKSVEKGVEKTSAAAQAHVRMNGWTGLLAGLVSAGLALF